MRLPLCHPWLIFAVVSFNFSWAQPTPTPVPLPPPLPSPVEFFRELLELNDAERANRLASRSESQRRSIHVKLREYAALPPAERELRLRATELRWYLRPFLEIDLTERAKRIVHVPEPFRSIVEQRLAVWDQLTPAARRDFLESDWAIQYFLRLETATPVERPPPLPQAHSVRRLQLERDFARWQRLPLQERQRAAERLQRFFQLPPVEQEKTIETLPEPERRQMESTLNAFAQLPAARRKATVNAFQRFAGLTEAERGEFLRNAERWKEMSPADRATWRRLVLELPPSPPGLFEPPPPPDPSWPMNRGRN
jgi:hypothetical protein